MLSRRAQLIIISVLVVFAVPFVALGHIDGGNLLGAGMRSLIVRNTNNVSGLPLAGAATGCAGRVVVITPTYQRSTRFADLVHVAATLQVAQSWGVDIHWILVEDGEQQDAAVRALLNDTGLPHDYLTQTAEQGRRYRELNQRNSALALVRDRGLNATVYQLDDDNAVRPELLCEIARLPSMSFTVFAVGNIGTDGVEAPIFDLVEPQKAVLSQWICSWCPRRWNIDMAGFAFSSDLLLHARRPPHFAEKCRKGWAENDFLRTIERAGGKLVVIPALIDRVLSWHDHSEVIKGIDYEEEWSTARLKQQRLVAGEHQLKDCRGHVGEKRCRFAWAARDLPLATVLS